MTSAITSAITWMVCLFAFEIAMPLFSSGEYNGFIAWLAGYILCGSWITCISWTGMIIRKVTGW